jgi:pilus assembly protein Flp/PilA
MKDLWTRFVDDESGQGLVEYVLIIALVAIGLVAIMLVFRNSIGNIFKTSANTLDGAPGTPYN